MKEMRMLGMKYLKVKETAESGTTYLRKKETASYTVEAAFVVSIVLGLAFVVLYTLFLLHDKVMLQANLENLIFLLVEEEDSEQVKYEKYLSNGLWILELKDVDIKSKKTIVKGSVVGVAALNIPILNMLINGEQRISASEKYYKIQPEEIIRYGPDFLKKGVG